MSKAKSKKAPKEVIKEFSLKKENATILKTIIKTIAKLTDEAKITINSDDLTIITSDESLISLIELKINKQDFDEFKCPNEMSITLNLEDLDKIMERGDINDTIELSFKESEQKIKVKMKNRNTERIRTFSLCIISTPKEDVMLGKLEKIEYEALWEMDPKLLIEALKDAEIYSDIFNIKTDKEKLTFTAFGQIGEMNYELELDNLEDSNIEGEEKGSYSISFLKKILTIASITTRFQIFIKTDYPLRLIFDILEGGTMQYFLAPRVDRDDFENDMEPDDLWEETDPTMKEITRNLNDEEVEEEDE